MGRESSLRRGGLIALGLDDSEIADRIVGQMLKAGHRPGVQFNEHIVGDGATIFEHARKLGFDGTGSKHREHPYRSGLSKSWIKIKNPTAPGRATVRGWRA